MGLISLDGNVAGEGRRPQL